MKSSERRDATVIMKVTIEERAAIEGWAKHLGIGISDFGRKAMLELITKLATEYAAKGGGS